MYEQLEFLGGGEGGGKLYCEKGNFIMKLLDSYLHYHVSLYRQLFQHIHYMQYSTMSNTCLQHSTSTYCIRLCRIQLTPTQLSMTMLSIATLTRLNTKLSNTTFLLKT